MLNLTKHYGGLSQPADALRYGHGHGAPKTAADGAYLLMRMMREESERFDEVGSLLEWNAGGRFSSGTGIGNIDTQGNVHPDQFW